MDLKELKILRTLTEIELKQNKGIIDIRGVSMEPLIYEGNCVLIEKCDCFVPGDILLVVDMNCRLLIHRLIRVIPSSKDRREDILVTKGDNTVGVDESYRYNCLGKAILVYKKDEEIYPYSKFRDKIVLQLSKRMNRKFSKGVPGEKLFKGWERKCIVRIFEKYIE